MIKYLIIKIINFYQFLSGYTVKRCRFYPQCSEYMIQSIEKHGEFYGICKGIKRILRCHPFNSGGYDPV